MEKTEKKKEDVSKAPEKIGQGFTASVYSPALVCKDWSDSENDKKKFTHITKLSASMTSLTYTIHVALQMRKAWAMHKLYWQQHSSHSIFKSLQNTPMKKLVIDAIVQREPDDFYNLPDSKLCTSCVLASPSESSLPLLGMYLPKLAHGWKEEFTTKRTAFSNILTFKDVRSIHHLIRGVLIAHFLGFTHNDLHRDNLMFHSDGLPRIIDWEHAILFLQHSSERKHERMTDQMPDDWHQYMAFWKGGKLWNTPKQQIAGDWAWVHVLINETFPPEKLQTPSHRDIVSNLQEWLKRGTDGGMRTAALELEKYFLPPPPAQKK